MLKYFLIFSALLFSSIASSQCEDPFTAELSNTSSEICNDGSTTDLTITINGGQAPFTINILRNGGSSLVFTTTERVFLVPVDQYGEYILDYVYDANGCEAQVSGSTTISYLEEVEATVEMVCSLETPIGGVTLSDTEFQIIVNVTSGDLGSIVVTEISALGITFAEISPGSGVWYSSGIDEINLVDINISDQNDCNGGVTFTGLAKVCSCPVSIDYNFSDDVICEGETTTLDINASGGNTIYDTRVIQPDQTELLNLGNTGNSIFEVSAAGNYIIQVTSVAYNCYTSIVVTLETYPVPEYEVTTDGVICEHTGVGQLTVNALNTPSFSFSYEKPAAASPYSITNVDDYYTIDTYEAGEYFISNFTDANGCISQRVTTVTVVELSEMECLNIKEDSLVITLLSSTTTPLAGQEISITAEVENAIGEIQIDWFTSNNGQRIKKSSIGEGSEITVIIEESTNYYAVATDLSTGATGTSEFLFDEEDIIASVQTNNSSVSIYPTVTSDILYSSRTLDKIEVYSQTGNLLKRYSQANSYDVSSLSSGIYWIKIYHSDTVKTEKLIIQK